MLKSTHWMMSRCHCTGWYYDVWAWLGMQLLQLLLLSATVSSHMEIWKNEYWPGVLVQLSLPVTFYHIARRPLALPVKLKKIFKEFFLCSVLIWLIISIYLLNYLYTLSENLWICHTVSASSLHLRVWSESGWNKYYRIVLWNGKYIFKNIYLFLPISHQFYLNDIPGVLCLLTNRGSNGSRVL